MPPMWLVPRVAPSGMAGGSLSPAGGNISGPARV